MSNDNNTSKTEGLLKEILATQRETLEVQKKLDTQLSRIVNNIYLIFLGICMLLGVLIIS